MSILSPSTNEIEAVRKIIEAASVYEPIERTARKAVQALNETRRQPTGTCTEALLRLCDAVSSLLADVKAQDALEALPGLARARIDLALVEARRHLQQAQDRLDEQALGPKEG